MRNAVALGTFDGLHKGHLAVLGIPDGYRKIALIFDIPPKCTQKGEVELLLTPSEKIKRLENLGFIVEILKFDEVKDLTAEKFLELVKEKFNPALISCGFNYRFGKGGLGDTALLESFCKENSITIQLQHPVTDNGEIVSSSLIRNALKTGDILKANRLLDYDFSFNAEVIKGDGRGTILGFPTVNQKFPDGLTTPKFGVYKTEITIDGEAFKGITNIGARPTFPTDYIICETFIIGFEGDLYGKNLTVTLKEFLREEKKFSNEKELTAQVLSDIEKIQGV